MSILSIKIIPDSTKVRVITSTGGNWVIQLSHDFDKSTLLSKVNNLEAGQLSKIERATNFKSKIDGIKTELSI